MESGITAYSLDLGVVDVIFARILTPFRAHSSGPILPKRSPLPGVRFQHRPTFHAPGDMSAPGEFCRGLPARSAHPGLLQAPAFVLVIAQALEDEVGMFSQARNRSGGASGFIRELQRGTQVLNSVWPA